MAKTARTAQDRQEDIAHLQYLTFYYDKEKGLPVNIFLSWCLQVRIRNLAYTFCITDSCRLTYSSSLVKVYHARLEVVE